MPITRETLYKEIWAEPMTVVAARYRMESNLLGRICERLNVPRPPRGYWAQLKVGRADTQPPLPVARPGDEVTWLRGNDHAPYAEPHVGRQLSDRSSRAISKPTWPHPLVADTKPLFEAGRITEEGYLLPAKRTLPDVFVTKESLSAALDILSALFSLCERFGHRIVFAPRDEIYFRPFLNHYGGKNELQGYDTWRPEHPTLIFVRGVAFGVTLFESAEAVEVVRLDGKYVRASSLPLRGRWANGGLTSHHFLPSGRACLRTYSPYSDVTFPFS